MSAPRLSQLESVFGNVISVVLAAAGMSALVMILIGGFGYLSSGGNKETAAKAQLTITYGILGLIVVISSWMILNILSTFLGVPQLLFFNICANTPC